MDPKFVVSLWTPGSDIVTGDPEANFEGIFGRAGNDVIYGYDPDASYTGSQDIDVLFGDIFDNSAQEFQTITDITQGNLLSILNNKIPSVGSDRFVLGDANQSYYTDNSGNPYNLITTNTFGLNEFAVIYDFDPNSDTIQLHGKPEDYSLVAINGLEVSGLKQPLVGKAIFSLQQGTPDLVAFVISPPEADLNLQDKYFQFVDTKSETKLAQEKIGQIGSNGIDFSYDTAVDPAGNVYFAGSTSGSLQGTNQGLTDAWVAKYDNKGNRLWGKQIGSADADIAYALTTDKDGNFYLAGTTGGDLFSTKQSEYQDAWLAKYDNNGNLLWGKQFQADLTAFSNPAFGLDVDEQGNIYLSGLGIKNNERTDIFSFAVQDDTWVTQFDSNGNQKSFTLIGSYYFDESYDLAIDRNGNTYVTGWSQGLVQESDPSRQLLKYDAWLAKVDTSGQVAWIQQFGSQNQGIDYSWGVATDSQNNIYVKGWTTGDLGGTNQGSYDVWLAKYSPDGNQQWVRQFGTSGDDGCYVKGIAVDSNNNIYLTGYTNGNLGGVNAGDFDSWVASYDSNGNQRWIQQFGSAQLDYGTDVSVDNAGNIFATGFTEGSLGGINAGAMDSWIAKLDANTGTLLTFNPSFSPEINPVVGTANSDRLLGTVGKDQINGEDGSDVIDGKESNDLLIGGSGNDTLVGGYGNDTLTGGIGNDTFVFDTGKPFVTSDLGTDKITDFTSTADKILLNTNTFTVLKNSIGAAFNSLTDLDFATVSNGADAKSSYAAIVYNSTDGSLFYNENGLASGFGSGGLFATLDGNPSLSAANFSIVA
ncbi:hypothetical protein A6770_21895 [Nostoc minutum NIES-26]|uniref:Hemolysin n=1 Tax=Nostoc minutum NIES-26 TaxID=1844469 RepID=A0A367R110_9NOSO|nr:hypothetical protein A6770_21895 [Nostoc minutum NIES-26]